ncbi:shugoshin 2-like isoform X1 [Acipenser ruthenus]|uniref:shugoshin 2-like isoform X1 n=1 Tax=Acipenser ruthenus TaxID=7906 RepID=UPI00274047E3|nr:shugoshin 2-like isoform X1 [Acipenser ruthenus]XP_058889913.1 shugoshin 2-like isoform X1 [Acipenser ruthenus]XP_058889915.1 shugoshin 2-like isoform X1 [Acipenser ruthenus]
MFAPATAGGPSTMDVLRERMLEKKQGSLKVAKLNTSLALKIKTKILNNSSIVHTSMKINNKALALALSAQKEKCKLLEQEMIKLQKEAVMLYVQNASYSHRQNHLLSLLKELQQSTHERLDAAVQMCSVEDCPSPTGSKRSSKPPLSNNAGTSFQNASNEATCAAQKSPVVSLEKPVLQPQPRRPVQEKCFLQSPLEENAVNRQPESGHFLENMQHIDQEDAGIFASPSPVVKEPSYPRVSPDRVIKKGRRSCLVTAALFESYSKESPGTDDSTVIKTGKKRSGVGCPGVSLAESNGSKESLELQVPKQETTVFDAEMELTVNEETEIVTVESNSRGKNIGENRTPKPRSKKGDPEALRNIKKKKRDPSKAIPLVNSTRPVSEKQRSIKPLDTDKAISDAVGSDLQTASSASAAEVSVAANKQLHQGEEHCGITDVSLSTECKDCRNTYKVSVFQNAEYTDCRKAGIVSSEALKYANKCEQSRAQLVQMEEPLDQPKDLLEENTLADFQTVETKPQDFLNVETKESRRTYLVSGPPSGTYWNTAGKDNRRTFVISDFQKAKPTASGLSHVEPGQEENLQNLALKDEPEENAHSSNLKLCDGAFVMSDRYVTKRENFIITPPLYKAGGYSVVEACETEVCESNSRAKVSKHKDNSSSRKRRNVVDEVFAEIGTHCNNNVMHSQPESGLNDPVVQRSAKRSRIPQKSCSNVTQGERNDNPNRKTYVVHPANKLKSSESSPENQTKKVKSKSRCAKVAFQEPGVPNPCFIFTHNESECVKGSKTASQENHLEVSGTPLKRESSSLATTNSDRAGGVILKLPCVQKASAGGGGGVRVCSVQDTCASEQTTMTVASPRAAAQRAEEHSAVLESLQKLVQEDSSLGGFQLYGPETQECGLFQNLHSLVNTVKESEKIARTVKRSRDKTPDGRILQTVTNTSLSTCEEAGIAKKRRRAAAVANYKEPRLNSKLRREDQEKLQPSVYKEYKKLNEIQIKLESDVPM